MAKVRGRRAEKKSAKEIDPEAIKKDSLKKFGGDDKEDEEEQGDEQNQTTDESNKQQNTSTFFGLVDANEIDYFKQAEATLNINAFESPEEREGFIRSVLEEARGKELKLVTNQICSKLMERLILSATDRQLKNLFKAFSNHFVALAHHKYSSHVLETLFVRAAALIEKELIDEVKEEVEDAEEDDEDENVSVTMEELFIQMVNEYKPHVNAMIDHQYSSHTLRLLLLILAGKDLPSSTTSNSTLRSKKSKIARKMIEIKDNDDFNRSFQVPPSFKNELRDVITSISAKYSRKDMKKLRELAIHKIASPVLQLIIQVEGIFDNERTVWHLIFAKDNAEKEQQEEAFVEYLLSDSVGSHFLENCIKRGGARMKYLERLYKLYMKDRVLKLSKRATTGVYIIQALLLKLKPVEVEHILDQLIPELSNLISISENQNLDLGRSVIDASLTRGNYRRDEIIQQLFLKFAPNYDYKHPSDSSVEFLENTLQLTGSTLGNTRDDWPTAEERRRSLFLEKLMEYDFSFVICVWYNFLALPQARFIQMCFHGVFSHVVESSLVVLPMSLGGEPKTITILRKRFLNIFQGEVANMSCNSYGSHIVDKLWDFTVLLNMYKDRIGSELMSESKKVKESTYGKMVWKNWKMELFARKKYDWKSLIKQQEEEYYSNEGDNNDNNNNRNNREEVEKIKKPIELKMEQLLREKQLKEEKSRQNEEWYLKRKNGGHNQQKQFAGLGDFKVEDVFNDNNKKQKVRGRNRV